MRKGNPKGIHTWDDLLKPGIEVLTPNPFTSGGAKWNILAAYGASRRWQGPQKGLAYLRELITKHVTVQDKSGREALQDFTVRQRRRPHLLRERGDHRPAEGPAGRLRDPGPDDPDREPDRRGLEVQAPRAGQGVPGLRALVRRPSRSSPTGATARSTRRCCERTRRSSPNPQRPVHHPTTSAGGAKVNDAFFDPDKGSWPRSRRTRGSPLPSENSSPHVPPHALPRVAAGGAGRARAGRRDAVAQPHRPDPARGRRRPLDRRRPRHFWAAVSSRQAVAALKLRCGRRWSSRPQRRGRDADRLGAGPRPVPRQGGVNALIDLPFALPTIVAGLILLALVGPTQPVRRPRHLRATLAS